MASYTKTHQLLLVVAVLLCCCQLGVTRPSFRPFGGFARLRAHSTAFVNHEGVHQDEFLFNLGNDSLVLKYRAQPKRNLVVHLDEEVAVEAVVCNSDMSMVLQTNSSGAAQFLHKKMIGGSARPLMTGGVEWGCVDSTGGVPKSILRYIEQVTVSGARLILFTSQATHQDFFHTLNVSFATTKLPPHTLIRQPATQAAARRQQHSADQPRRVLGSWGSFFSGIWNDVENLAGDIADAVNAVAYVANFLSTGDASFQNSFLNMYQNWNSNTTVPLDEALQCSNCWGVFDFGVNFDLDISDYQLNNLALVASGNVEFNIEANLWYQASFTDDGGLPIYTLVWPNIVFTVAGVPFVLTVTMPISEVWTVQASGAINVVANVQAQGSICYGVMLNGGQLAPVNSHTYDEMGQFSQVQLDVSADVTLGLQLAPVVEVDYIGNINFGINPYVEASLDYNSNSGCENAGGLRAVLNWGLGTTVGFNISVGSIFSENWGPIALFNIKKPITSGCVQYSMLPGEDRPAVPDTVPIVSGPLVVGNTWHGWQIPSQNCEPGLYPYANVTFQYIDYESDGSLDFVVSFNSIMPDYSWCVIQALYNVVYDDNGNVAMKPWGGGPYAVSYSQCQNPVYSVGVLPIYGTISDNNWDQITVQTADGCVTLAMQRTLV